MKADETKRKREILLGINPCIYGLNYHDPAVVVLIDGRVVFGVEEERCNRVKHSKGVFPSLALAECLTYCNLTWDDIDAVVIGYEPALWMNRLNLELLDIINPFVSCVSNSIQIRGSEIVEKIIRTNIVDRYTFFRSQENVRKLIIEKCSALETTKVMFCEHHLAHIASSYEVSGFSEAVLFHLITFFQVPFVLQYVNHDVIEVEYQNSESIWPVLMFFPNVFNPLADCHLLLRRIIEDIVPDFIAEALVLPEGGFLNGCFCPSQPLV